MSCSQPQPGIGNLRVSRLHEGPWLSLVRCDMQSMTGRMQALAQELATARERAGLAANLSPAAAAERPVRAILSL